MATPPAKLSPVHVHMCALAAAGMKRYEIAGITGYSEAQITNVLSHPDAELLIARLTTDIATRVTDDVAHQIQSATGEAFQTIVHLMRNGESERVRQLSAFDILDRGGFKPKEIHVNADIQVPAEEAKLIRETIEHMGREIPYRPPLENAVKVLTKGQQKDTENTVEDEKEEEAA